MIKRLKFLCVILGTLIRSSRICIFKSCRRSSFSDFLVVWVFESLHVVGLALLFFVVLPDLDVVKGAMLTNCVAFIPAILGDILNLRVCLRNFKCPSVQKLQCPRKSAPVVKANSTYMKLKSDRVNLVASASPIQCLLY